MYLQLGLSNWDEDQAKTFRIQGYDYDYGHLKSKLLLWLGVGFMYPAFQD